MKNILITGGTGLIGSRLTSLLAENGYNVSILTRKPRGNGTYKEFKWDIDTDYVDSEAIENADYIIHLAGAGIADKRWSNERKKELYHSRIGTANLLYRKCSELDRYPQAFISASGINIYGLDSGEAVQWEDQPELGSDFIAELCKDWESAAAQFADMGTRVVCLRTPMVLAREGGALPKMSLPVKWGLGAPLGSGKQIISWIHIEDLCRLYLFAIENSILGAFNASASQTLTNREFMARLAKSLSRPYFMPVVPAFLLKGFLGEMAGLVLGGNNASNEKILGEGFEFTFPGINSALENLK